MTFIKPETSKSSSCTLVIFKFAAHRVDELQIQVSLEQHHLFRKRMLIAHIG